MGWWLTALGGDRPDAITGADGPESAESPCVAFQNVADCSDQFYSGDRFTLNVYYRCGAGATEERPEERNDMIRADCWTQLLTLEDEASGRPGKRWYCRCGARSRCRFGVVIDKIDHTEFPRAGHPRLEDTLCVRMRSNSRDYRW